MNKIKLPKLPARMSLEGFINKALGMIGNIFESINPK